MLLRQYGLEPPPAIDSIEASEWIIRAAYCCIKKDSPDLLYCTTNDYIFHHFAPGTKEAAAQIRALDSYIEKIAALETAEADLHYGRSWHEPENKNC